MTGMVEEEEERGEMPIPTVKKQDLPSQVVSGPNVTPPHLIPIPNDVEHSEDFQEWWQEQEFLRQSNPNDPRIDPEWETLVVGNQPIVRGV